MVPHYWWGDGDNQRRLHWFVWWKLCVPKKEGGTRFQDIHCFNLAVLAKQAWRLIDNLDSLCARVLKAKYYLDCGISNATPKKRASFTWKSFMLGLQTLKRGHIWMIGDGIRINVWDDEWIPNSPTRKVIRDRGGNLLSKVSDFIDPVTGSWDEELVSQTFWQVDVTQILVIPLPEFDMSDFVAWNLCKNRRFSVRSAYFAEWHNQYGHKISGENLVGPSQNSPIWGTIWSLSCPTKIFSSGELC